MGAWQHYTPANIISGKEIFYAFHYAIYPLPFKDNIKTFVEKLIDYKTIN